MREEALICIWFLVLTDSTVVATNGTFNETEMYGLTSEVFNKYNENAATFQTGVLVRLNDDNFLFGNASDPLGLSCTEGYMRPVVLNVIRSKINKATNIFQTQVVMKNLTIFYKDCRVLEESEMFLSGTLKTPCFLTIDISSLIGWAIIKSNKLNNKDCQNSIYLDMGDDITGAGTVRLFFLRSSTLYTFSLFLDDAWTKKIQEAVARTSLILLSDFNECVDLPETNPDPPTFEVTTVLDNGPGYSITNKDDLYDDEDQVDDEDMYGDYYEHGANDKDYNPEITSPRHQTTAEIHENKNNKKFHVKNPPEDEPSPTQIYKHTPVIKDLELPAGANPIDNTVGQNGKDGDRLEIIKIPENM
uniref:Uncharacterized protein n=1 Tax=Lygus hesperus TaxID=30085 RepID=A0A0K8SLQ1_LYGHE